MYLGRTCYQTLNFILFNLKNLLQERCTIWRFEVLTLNDGKTFIHIKGPEKLYTNLVLLKDFDKPKTNKWEQGSATIITHITSETIKKLFKSFVINKTIWFAYFEMFLITWVLAEPDRAGRITCKLQNGRIPHGSFPQTTLLIEFIEFGKKSSSSKPFDKLIKCVKKLQKTKMGPESCKKLNKKFPNYFSKKMESYGQSKIYWIKFVSAETPPTVECFTEKPSWFDSGDNLEIIPAETKFDWKNDIILCFTIWKKMHPEYKIVLKQVDPDETGLVFCVQGKNLDDEFSLFFGVLTNVLLKKKKNNELKTFAKGALSLVPFVGSTSTIIESVDSFRSGNCATGMCLLALGVVGLAADVTMVGGPAASFVRKVATSSPKVVAACKTITKTTAKANKFTKYTGVAANLAKSAIPEPSNKREIIVSDEKLLKTVFPRIYEIHNNNK